MVSTERGTRVPGGGASALRRPGADVPAPERWPVLAVVGTTLLAVVLGLYQLGGPALSYDEGYTVGVVRGPFSDTWMRVTNWDTVQAPYYLVFSLWYDVGESEFLLRLPSVAFFVASIPLVFGLGRRLVDDRVGAVAAVLLCLNGLALSWAQQARSYSMALFGVTLASYLLVRALDRPGSTGRAVAYGVVAAVAVYAHFLVGLVVAAHALSLLLLRPRPWRVLAVGFGVVAALTVPAGIWVLTLNSDPLEWIARPSLRYLLAMLADVAGGGPLQLVVLGAAAALGLLAAWACQRERPGSRAAWGLAMPALWLVLPVATLIASTYTVKPLLHARYLVIVVPAFTLVAAAGLVAVVDRRPRWAVPVAAVAVLAAVAGAVSHVRAPDAHEWRTATEVVQAGAEPGDGLVVVPFQGIQAVEYYQRRLPGEHLPVLLPRRGDPPAGDRLWEVERVRERPRDPDAYTPMPGYDQWRDEHYVLVDEQVVSEQVVVRRYDRRP